MRASRTNCSLSSVAKFELQREPRVTSSAVQCPICTIPEPLISADGFECATCGHEWLADLDDTQAEVRDSNGKMLADGDDVVIIRDLKLDGKRGGIKVGTKVRSIRLVPGDHPIQGKVDGRTVLIIADKVKKA